MINDYYIAKAEADKQLALKVEKLAKQTGENVIDILSEISDGLRNGVTRVSWYSSCFTETYKDVCENQFNEDKRLGSTLIEIVSRTNFYLDIIELFVRYTLNRLDNTKREIVIYKILEKISHFVAKGKTVELISVGIASLIAKSAVLKPKAAIRLKKASNIIIMILTSYGNAHELSLAAQNLKQFHPWFYHILYKNNLELLYFYVKPVLENPLFLLKHSSSAEEVAKILIDLINGTLK